MYIFFVSFLTISSLYSINWNLPSLEDLRSLQQEYINDVDEICPYFDTFDEFGNRITNHRPSRYKHYRFYSEELKEIPKFQVKSIGGSNPLNQCVLIYCGLNGPYKYCIEEIIEALEKQNYQGDVLFQVGGWPYLAEDSLSAFKTPYGFKPCAVMEAMKRGYDLVLWLDTVLIPVCNMRDFFNKMKDFDIMIYDDSLSFDHPFYLFKIMNHSEDLLNYLKWKPQQMVRTNHLNTAVIGFNFRSFKTKLLVNKWFEMAKDGVAFNFASVDQLPFSYLVKYLKINAHIMPNNKRFESFKNHEVYSYLRQ